MRRRYDLVIHEAQMFGRTDRADMFRLSRYVDEPPAIGRARFGIAPNTAITGRLHDAPNSEFVSIVTRNGNPPDTVSFKPEQLGFSKQLIEEIAARDPSGRISNGIDQYHHPVVNAQSDLARGDDQSRAPVGV